MSEIGERLRTVRKKLRLSLRQLEKSTGVHYTTISKYENGVTFPYSDFLEKLSSLHKVNPNYLIIGIGPQLLDEEVVGQSEYQKLETFDFTSKLLNERLQQITDEIAELREKVEGK